jgi:hypothetical protein
MEWKPEQPKSPQHLCWTVMRDYRRRSPSQRWRMTRAPLSQFDGEAPGIRGPRACLYSTACPCWRDQYLSRPNFTRNGTRSGSLQRVPHDAESDALRGNTRAHRYSSNPVTANHKDVLDKSANPEADLRHNRSHTSHDDGDAEANRARTTSHGLRSGRYVGRRGSCLQLLRSRLAPGERVKPLLRGRPRP